MPVTVEGLEYIPAAELIDELKITRQTLWRWRTGGKIPPGHRYRDRKILFTPEEAQRAREYANQVTPLDPVQRDQLQMFS